MGWHIQFDQLSMVPQPLLPRGAVDDRLHDLGGYLLGTVIQLQQLGNVPSGCRVTWISLAFYECDLSLGWLDLEEAYRTLLSAMGRRLPFLRSASKSRPSS